MEFSVRWVLHKSILILWQDSFVNNYYNFFFYVRKVPFRRVRTGPGNPGKSLNFKNPFPGLESLGILYAKSQHSLMKYCLVYFPWCRKTKRSWNCVVSIKICFDLWFFLSWKIEKKSWKGPGKVLEFVWLMVYEPWFEHVNFIFMYWYTSIVT